MDSLQGRIENLINSMQTCSLATINAKGEPEASTTPFIFHDNALFIFISELATHTQNLQNTPNCSVLLSEDESSSKNIFAKRRLILKGDAEQIASDEIYQQRVLDIFAQQRGQTIELLRTLPDFHLFKIVIRNGQYVEGFGAAYRFDALDFASAKQESGK